MVVEESNKIKSETRYLSLLMGTAAFIILLFGLSMWITLDRVASWANSINNVGLANYAALLAWGELIVSLLIMVMLAMFLRYINKRMRKRSVWFQDQIKKMADKAKSK